MAAVVRTHSPAANAAEEPRDALVVRKILRSVGLREGEYDSRVVPQLVEVARRYAGDVLVEARAYADHAGRASLQAEDVRLAIRANAALSPVPPRREVMLDLARSRNTIQLPRSSAPRGSIPLPPLQDIMLSENYLCVRRTKPSTEQAEEMQDANEGSNLNPNPSTVFSGHRASKKQKQKNQPAQKERVTCTAARRRRMNS
ncbi:hypothetical protein QOZ80_7BG0608250 [Eleusine coracana subsp. coracana]|nr:hypothetical protein QOZ80_7BG0608250 [Eleusine coracana subsp. coracana]